MSQHWIVISLVIAGLINLAPVAGLVMPQRLDAAYGVRSDGQANLVLLLRHRALLFGLMGGFALVSTMLPSLWLTASLLLMSMVGFVALVFSCPSRNDKLSRVAWIDVAACLPLLVSLVMQLGLLDQ